MGHVCTLYLHDLVWDAKINRFSSGTYDLFVSVVSWIETIPLILSRMHFTFVFTGLLATNIDLVHDLIVQ